MLTIFSVGYKSLINNTNRKCGGQNLQTLELAGILKHFFFKMPANARVSFCADGRYAIPIMNLLIGLFIQRVFRNRYL